MGNEESRRLDVRLAGKVAIVTGSSRGIGKAIALALAREGADIVIAARTEVAKGELPGTIGETAEAVRALGRRALAVQCNVGDEDDVNKMVQRTMGEFDRIDILVNNAAVAYYVPLVETPAKHWDLVMRVNVKGPYLCCQAVIPVMARSGGGSIVNISSRAAEEIYTLVKYPDGSRRTSGLLYGASKAALERLTRGLAPEVAALNIAVNAVKPAEPTLSDGMKMWHRDADPDLWVLPDQYMAKAAVFLATQDGHGITGEVFLDQSLCRDHGLV